MQVQGIELLLLVDAVHEITLDEPICISPTVKLWHTGWDVERVSLGSLQKRYCITALRSPQGRCAIRQAKCSVPDLDVVLHKVASQPEGKDAAQLQ